MIEDYNSFSCMLSMLHYVENLNIKRIRSKKELYEHMRSLIELLCKDRESRMYFMSMSGERGEVWVDEKGCVKRLERGWRGFGDVGMIE